MSEKVNDQENTLDWLKWAVVAAIVIASYSALSEFEFWVRKNRRQSQIVWVSLAIRTEHTSIFGTAPSEKLPIRI